MELLDKRIGAFRIEIAAGQIRAQILSIREFKAYGAPELFRRKDAIARRQWIVDRENA